MNFCSVRQFSLSVLSAAHRADSTLGLPVHLSVEPINVCQLHCPVCETGAGIMRRPRGMMSAQDFEKVLDNVGRQVNTIFLYWMGEPLLNKELPEMVDIARRRGIFTSICTNGEVSAVPVIEAGVSEISFQVGGLTETAHQAYRVGGRLERAEANVEAAARSRDHARSPTKIRVGFIVMRHNEQQVPRVVEHFKELGADHIDIINPCVRTMQQAVTFLPEDERYWIYDPAAFRDMKLVPRVRPHNRCWWIYFSTVVAWNGDVVPCCRDVQGDWVLGNALREDFREIWNGEKAQEFRRQVKENQRDLAVCRLCSGYLPPLLRRCP